MGWEATLEGGRVRVGVCIFLSPSSDARGYNGWRDRGELEHEGGERLRVRPIAVQNGPTR